MPVLFTLFAFVHGIWIVLFRVLDTLWGALMCSLDEWTTWLLLVRKITISKYIWYICFVGCCYLFYSLLWSYIYWMFVFIASFDSSFCVNKYVVALTGQMHACDSIQYIVARLIFENVIVPWQWHDHPYWHMIYLPYKYLLLFDVCCALSSDTLLNAALSLNFHSFR